MPAPQTGFGALARYWYVTMNPLKNAPYPGLRPFEQRESVYFFGRSQQIGEVIARLRRRHFAAIIGGSGCGKSSLVRAGVIPELLSYAIEEEGDFWIPVIYNPEDRPIERLAEALDHQLEPIDPNHRVDSLRAERLRKVRSLLEWGDGLVQFLETFRHEIRIEPGCEDLRDEANLLVVIDQFEEIFRKPAQAQQVLQLTELILETYSNPKRHIYLILTMRSEDLHRCAQFLRLPEVLNECAYLARRLDERELRDAIVNPAALVGAAGDSPSSASDESKGNWDRAFEMDVLKQIYADAATIRDDPDHLPLLQHLLFQIWNVAVARAHGRIPSSILVSDLETVLRKKRARPGKRLPSSRTWQSSDSIQQPENRLNPPSLLKTCLAVAR